MAIYSIVTGSGFTGNAQRCSGSYKEGIFLNNLQSGSLYAVSFQYKSDVDLAIWSGDYTDQHVKVNPIPIPNSSGSVRNWSGDILCLKSEENFIGIDGNYGYFDLDQLQVRSIPNLVINGTFDAGASGWQAEEPATQTFADGVVHYVNTTAGYGVHFSGVNDNLLKSDRRYRLAFQIRNLVSGGLRIGGTGLTLSGNYVSNGVHNYDFIYAGGGLGRIYISAISGMTSTLDLDNVHVYEIPDVISYGNHTAKTTLLDKYAGTSSLLISSSGAGRGNELVTNGVFATDPTTYWSYNRGTPTWNSVSKDYTFTANGVAGWSYLTKSTITSSGVVEIRFDAKSSNSTHKPDVQFATGRTVISQPDLKTTYQTYIFRSTTAIVELSIMAGLNLANGIEVTFDNISVKEYYGEIALPYAQTETIVAGNKYTLEGFAKVDPTSLTYGSNLIGVVDLTNDSYYSGNIYTYIINATQFTSSNASNNLYINRYSLVDTKIYKLITDITVDSGTYYIRDGNSSTNYVSGNGTYYFTGLQLSGTSNQFIIRLQNVGATATINTLELYEASIDSLSITLQLGTKFVISSVLNPTTWTKFVSNFEASATEVNQDIKLYLNTSASVYVDNVSLTQRYDYAIMTTFKNIKNYTYNVAHTIFGRTSTNGASNGISIGIDNSETIYLQTTEAYPIVSLVWENTYSLQNNVWYNFMGVLKGDDRQYYYRDFVLKGTSSLASIGKVMFAGDFLVGKISFASEYVGGYIGSSQILRFTNISQSNFNPTTYKIGQSLLGGGAEVVLWFDPSKDGSSIENTIKDWSGNNNNLLASSIDLTNRVLTH